MATEIALVGYLSSVCATKSTASSLLPPNFLDTGNESWNFACDVWKQKSFQTNVPENTIYQSNWDIEICKFKQQTLLLTAPSNEEKARLMAVSSRFASAWLNAIPIPSLGLKLDPMSLKVASGLCLGSPLCHPHQCICGVTVESNGHHGLACKKQSGRRSRHDQVNDLIKRALVQGKIPAVTEPSGLSRNDGKRPDGLSLISWKSGKCLIWDFTVADTLCKSYINQTVISAGAAADTRETQKISKYSSLTENYLFVPIGVETFGLWGQ